MGNPLSAAALRTHCGARLFWVPFQAVPNPGTDPARDSEPESPSSEGPSCPEECVEGRTSRCALRNASEANQSAERGRKPQPLSGTRHYFLKNFLLPRPARPIRPVPRSSMVAGSGTGAPPGATQPLPSPSSPIP